VPGTREKTEFCFTLTLDEPIDPKMVEQWYTPQIGENSNWVKNSENSRVIVEDYTRSLTTAKKTLFVYLILDASASTEEKNREIRSAAKNYLEALYSEMSAPPDQQAAAQLFEPAPAGSGGKPRQPPASVPPPARNTSAAAPKAPAETGVQDLRPGPAVKSGQPSASVPPPVVPASVPKTPVETGTSVQVGAYEKQENAQDAYQMLVTNQYTGRIVEAKKNGRPLYRVQAGPYKTLQEATEAVRRLKALSSEFRECFIP
jgi:cell division protein FtsN